MTASNHHKPTRVVLLLLLLLLPRVHKTRMRLQSRRVFVCTMDTCVVRCPSMRCVVLTSVPVGLRSSVVDDRGVNMRNLHHGIFYTADPTLSFIGVHKVMLGWLLNTARCVSLGVVDGKRMEQLGGHVKHRKTNKWHHLA